MNIMKNTIRENRSSENRKRKSVLSIAGSDSSGGAGIQADLKTFLAQDVYGMSVITALTAQNTTGVRSTMASGPEFLRDQLEAVFEDIRPDAVKIGIVASVEQVDVIARCLTRYNAKNVVLDPVMIATSGAALAGTGVVVSLVKALFSKVALITPNLHEARVLLKLTETSGVEELSKKEPAEWSEHDIEQPAEAIGTAFKCNVLLKGGHRKDCADDLLYESSVPPAVTWFRGTRIGNPNTHGTGCTLSSAIAANLAKGYGLKASVARAKRYLEEILKSDFDLGAGSGPLDHGYLLRGMC